MAPNTLSIPAVDISHLMTYDISDIESNEFRHDVRVKQIVEEVKHAFGTWGFLYLEGHQIPQRTISNAFQTAKNYFEQGLNDKLKLLRTSNDENFGYNPLGSERLEPQRPLDLKECFDLSLNASQETEMKAQHPEFYIASKTMNDSCKKLSIILLRILDLTLDLDEAFFVKQHQHMCDDNVWMNMTCLRLLYYKAIPETEAIAANQLRCSAHSDYGTMTLLFQDSVGGLQVLSPTGEFMDVTPRDGCIVVNVGDCMDMWSSGRLKSTKHRVVIKQPANIARQSIAYFVKPDNHVDIQNIDGDGYSPKINTKKHVLSRYESSYVKSGGNNND